VNPLIQQDRQDASRAVWRSAGTGQTHLNPWTKLGTGEPKSTAKHPDSRGVSGRVSVYPGGAGPRARIGTTTRLFLL
jgi:hypothetical protein